VPERASLSAVAREAMPSWPDDLVTRFANLHHR
jgi:hypothetical protein